MKKLFAFLKNIKREQDSYNDPLGERYHISETDRLNSMLEQAIDIIYTYHQASASILQRYLSISFKNAMTILSKMEEAGIISSFDGKNSRKILVKSVLDAKRIIKNQLNNSYSVNFREVVRPGKDLCIEQFGSNAIDYALSVIDGMDGHEFEHWCANLLIKNGFQNVEVTPGSGDQGVDITAEKDGVFYAIQCKCYSSDLGNKPVQEVYAGKEMYNCQVGVVMTNRYFTEGAKALAKQTRTLLWDRDKIQEMIQASIN